MFAAGMIDLLVRMLTSLALVLGIIAIAYLVMRHRAGVSPRPSRPSRPAASRAGRQGVARPSRPARRSNRAAIEVIGRVGLSRSSAAVALKFGDKVLLVGAAEQSPPTVLAEVDAATWELFDADTEWAVPAPLDDSGDAPTTRPGFLDALREATVRRA